MPLRASPRSAQDRKSTRLNSSHVAISYAVFCLKKKTNVVGNMVRRGALLMLIFYYDTGANELVHLMASMRVALGDLLINLVARIGVFFVNDTATTEIYTLSLHDALPI